MNWHIFWQFSAGLGIFLFGMHLLEESLKKLAGRTFKLFLKKHTGNKIEALFSGTIVTAVLQSSSVVSMMVLAFVGAGVLSMRNGLAVVFGSNFGTTLDSWVVALLGFNFNIENFALPVISISAAMMVFLKLQKFRNIGEFGLGFGFLFFGLHYMKTAMETLFIDFDFTPYADFNVLFFVFIGFVITALIQSSSATMVIVLSALYTGTIPFHAAAAVVIGSELGTTIKIILGSISGNPAKKRIAVGNLIFNIAITVFAVSFISPLINLVIFIAGGSNELIALVLFQSIINFTGLLIFYPLMDKLSGFLEKLFVGSEKISTFFISGISTELPDIALDGMEKEAGVFVNRVIHLNLATFHIEEDLFTNYKNGMLQSEIIDLKNPFDINYENLKEAEGEITLFYTKLRKEKMEESEMLRLDHLIATIRNAMHSTKSLKDIRHNRQDFRNSADDIKYGQYKYFQKRLMEFYKEIEKIAGLNQTMVRFEELSRLLHANVKEHEKGMLHIYGQAGAGMSENDISTLLNVNMAIYSSNKSLIHAFKYYLLDEKQISDFDTIPIRTF